MGQIGFNEPGTYTNTRTRLVALGNESRKAAASIFYGINYVPHKAITMGLRTILDAKRIILIAWGEEKRTSSRSWSKANANCWFRPPACRSTRTWKSWSTKAPPRN